MSVGRRTFIIVGGASVVGAGTYAWLRRLGYDVDPSPDPRLEPARAKAGALPFEPFDPGALGVLAVLTDHLLPGDPARSLPSASDAGVLDYLVAAAREPGMRAVRDEVLKLTRHLDLIARKKFGATLATLSDPAREAEVIEEAASGSGERPTFSPARALEATLRLSLEGYLGHPDHGGNRNGSAWDALSIAMPRERSPHAHGG